MTNWMIDNRTTKLVSVLKEQLQADSELSLILKNLSLSGFAALHDQLKGSTARLLLGMDDQSLIKRMACQPSEEKPDQQQVNGQTVYNVACGSLVACFDENISLDTVQAIIDLSSEDEPFLRIVFRNSSFADDIVKTNVIQRFKQAGIEDVLSI